MTKTKKIKLASAICIPAAVIGAAACVSAILLTRNNKDVSNKNLTITFNTDSMPVSGELKVKAATGELIKDIQQPAFDTEKLEKEYNKLFLHWVDENGKQVLSDTAITKSMTLNAVFAPANSTSYSRVVFMKGSHTGVTLSGTTTVAIRKGYSFHMINMPSAKCDGYKFLGWALTDGKSKATDVIKPDYVFTAEKTELYPVFEKQVKLQYVVGSAASIAYGKDYDEKAEGTIFQNYNKPTAYHNDNYLIEGWYTADPAGKDQTWLTANRWYANDVVGVRTEPDGTTIATKAYARWTAGTDDQKVTVTCDSKGVYVKWVPDASEEAGGHYTKVSDVDVKYENGTSQFNVLKTEHFVDINKPDPYVWDGKSTGSDPLYRNNFKFVAWQAYDSTAQTWTYVPLESTYQFTENVTMRPILETTCAQTYVTGETSQALNSKADYYGYASGGTEQRFNWTLKVYSDETKQTEITSTGWLSVNTDDNIASVTIPEETTGVVMTITATHKLSQEAGNTNSIDVKINNPYVGNSLIWTKKKVGTVTKWYYTTMDNLCSENSIVITPKDGGTAETITRAEFNLPIYVGTQNSILMPYFLNGCTSFNSDIVLSNVKSIGDDFLAGCTSFNQTLNLINVKRIGNQFLAGCQSFNQPLDIYAEEIGSNFLFHSVDRTIQTTAPAFNKPITFVEVGETGSKKANIWYIASNFLSGCVNFNQSIILPSTLSYVGDRFMNYCDAFKSTLTVNCNVTAISPNEYSICGQTAASAIGGTGFTIAGTYAVQFYAMFPPRQDATAGIFRKYVNTPSI